MAQKTKKRGRPSKKTTILVGSDIADVAQEVAKDMDDIEIKVVPSVNYVEKEVIVEKIVEIPEKRLTGFALYKKLKDSRYPQGGMGRTIEDPNGLEKVYIPRPEEIYTQFIADPEGWNALTDALARAWIELSIKK